MPSRNPRRIKLARAFRRAEIPAEKLLWKELRATKLGFKFRRQHSIGRYFVDFACCECLVVVELDGDSHVSNAAKAEDVARTRELEAAGWYVIRFWNPDVFDNLEGVLESIAKVCEGRKATPPSP